MNHYLASQLVAEHQAVLTADLPHRTQLKAARTARKATVTAASRPARTRRPVFGRLAIA